MAARLQARARRASLALWRRLGEHLTMQMSARALTVATALTLAAALSGCQSPCERLAERLCAAKGVDNAQCTSWELRSQRVPAETCERALRMLDRERIR